MRLTGANTDPRSGDPEPPNRAAEAERVSDELSQLAARLRHTEGHDGASGGHDRASDGATILPEHAAPVDALPDAPTLRFSSMSEAIQLGLLDAQSSAPCAGSSAWSRARATSLPPIAHASAPAPASAPAAVEPDAPRPARRHLGDTDPRDGDPDPPTRAAEAEPVSDELSRLPARLRHTEGHDGASGGDDRASNGDTILREHAAPVDALPDPPPVLRFSSTSEAIERHRAAYRVLGKIAKVESIPATCIERQIVDAIASLASPRNPLSNILFNIRAAPVEVIVRFDNEEAPDIKLTITAEVALDLDVLGK